MLSLGLGIAVPAVQAGYYDDIGFTALQAELGGALPDGDGLKVTLVEALNTADPPAWAPDPGSRSITAGDGGPSVGPPYSGHATNSANLFFGDASTTPAIGVAPGPAVSAYEAGAWLSSDFLKAGQTKALPAATGSRVANHSYVATLGVDAGNLETLRRLDWLIATDDYLQVVGFTGTANPLLAGAFNAIAVTKTGSPTNAGSAAVPGDPAYNVSRPRPHLVAPEKTPSSATARVASAVALLVHTAQRDPSLSNGSTSNRHGDTILHAASSEVIRAALMAAADRSTSNTHPAEAPVDIVGYRANPADRTDNGLDRRYGAGQLNVYHAYRIITAGEQNSAEDGGGTISRVAGFDYDEEFGGMGSSNSTASYYFSSAGESIEFAASLTWNIAIDAGGDPRFGRDATLYNLDLFLYDISNPADWILLEQSASTAENTENIRHVLPAQRDYVLQVRRAAGQGNFLWDYGVAWRSYVPGDIDGNGAVDVADLLQLQRAITGDASLDRPQMSRADVYPPGGNGNLDVADVITLQKIVQAP